MEVIKILFTREASHGLLIKFTFSVSRNRASLFQIIKGIVILKKLQIQSKIE